MIRKSVKSCAAPANFEIPFDANNRLTEFKHHFCMCDYCKSGYSLIVELRPEVMFMKLIFSKSWNEFHYLDNEYKEKNMNDFHQNNYLEHIWYMYLKSIFYMILRTFLS